MSVAGGEDRPMSLLLRYVLHFLQHHAPICCSGLYMPPMFEGPLIEALPTRLEVCPLPPCSVQRPGRAAQVCGVHQVRHPRGGS